VTPAEELAGFAEQARRAFEGEAWHGPAVLELLEDVTAEEAAARPAPGAHSIWEVALHIGAWDAIVVRRMAGETLVEVPEAEDWPQPGPSAASWDATRQALREGNRRLRQAIAALDGARLDAPVPGKDYDHRFLLHGVVQHDLYHAGQIALLKRSLRARKP
jgi:uncharacterized damage-inducible protein DinB